MPYIICIIRMRQEKYFKSIPEGLVGWIKIISTSSEENIKIHADEISKFFHVIVKR